MSEEEKGFIIKDKRSLDEKGDLKDKKSKKGKKVKKPKSETPKDNDKTIPLPEVNFTSLIFSLSSTVLFHFGEIPDPKTGEKKVDLELAKHTIDTIAMLKEKTAGNLTNEEQQFLENILTDLRWRYVKVKK